MLRIDTVVLSVCPDETYVHNSICIIEMDDKSVLVSSNVENDAISLKKAGMPVSAFDVVRANPRGF